jgi:hypothetical protein
MVGVAEKKKKKTPSLPKGRRRKVKGPHLQSKSIGFAHQKLSF